MAESEIKWIKLSTGIFDNDKIKQIEALPDGDSLIVIWLKLLVLAGEKNDGGAVYFTKTIPYSDQMLSVAFRRPLPTVQLALRTFESFGMIEIINDFFMLPNWEKYQNVEGMERVREQAKKRMRDYRERKRLADGNPETESDENERCYADVTQRYTDVTHQNKNKSKNKSKKEDINTIPPRNNDTEKGNDRTYRAGAEEEIYFEGVSENGTDFERAGRACEAEIRGTEASAGRGSGNPQNGVPGNKPLDWRDLSKDRLH